MWWQAKRRSRLPCRLNVAEKVDDMYPFKYDCSWGHQMASFGANKFQFHVDANFSNAFSKCLCHSKDFLPFIDTNVKVSFSNNKDIFTQLQSKERRSLTK